MTKVVSIRSGNPYDIEVIRPGPFGNPFSHLRTECTTAQYHALSRYDSVRKFAEWILTQPELLAQVKRELRDKTLGCACGQKDIDRGMCHGVVLAKIADEGRRFS